MITDREIKLEKEVIELQRLMVKVQLGMIARQGLDIDVREKSVDVEIEARTKEVQGYGRSINVSQAGEALREVGALERDRMQLGEVPCPCNVKCLPCIDRDAATAPGLTD